VRENLIYDVSRWQKYLYESELQSNEALTEVENKGSEKYDQFPSYNLELFSRLYNPKTKELDEKADCSWAKAFHEQASNLPEFQTLQLRCKGDEAWAGMATATLSNSLLDMKQKSNDKQLEEEKRRLESLEDLLSRGVDIKDKVEAAKKKVAKLEVEKSELDQLIDPAQIRSTLRKAIEQTQQEISETEQAINAFSYGDQPGTPRQLKDADEKRQLAERLKSSKKLKKIAELAGRLRLSAARKHREKSKDPTEVTSIEIGGDVSRVLPSELALLDPELELLFDAKLLEGKLLQYSLEGKVAKDKGPIIICIDESGSMRNLDYWSKATMLAIIEIATRDKRRVDVIHFDSKVQWHDIIIETPTPTQLINICEHFSGGGTSFEVPMNAAATLVERASKENKADIILITDGVAAESEAAHIREIKSSYELNVLTVLINKDESAAAALISDKIVNILDITDETLLQASDSTIDFLV